VLTIKLLHSMIMRLLRAFAFGGNAGSSLLFNGANKTFTGNITAGGSSKGIIDASTNSATVVGNIGALVQCSC
jgi:hypothetical protein